MMGFIIIFSYMYLTYCDHISASIVTSTFFLFPVCPFSSLLPSLPHSLSLNLF